MTITFSKLGEYGRLGNSMFQMAATIGLATKHNDTFMFPNWEFYVEERFNLPDNTFRPDHQIKYSSTYDEPHFHYKEIPYKPNMNLMGYFQSEKYFAHCKPLIRSCFKEDVENMPKVCSIHVRRGDYIEPHLNGCYENLDMEYYNHAMKMTDANHFIVCSDDIEWCKSQFESGLKYNFSFSEASDDPLTDMQMMASCGTNIIANSSFSWWAAWLNNNENKKVIAPQKWFGPKLAPTHDTKDLYPEEWIKI